MLETYFYLAKRYHEQRGLNDVMVRVTLKRLSDLAAETSSPALKARIYKLLNQQPCVTAQA